MGRRASIAAIVGITVALAAAGARGAPARLDLAALKERVSPALCAVTVENAWGIPQSVSTGFLLGNGRFVVCDLGSLRHRGAARVTLRFADGATLRATQFGMADPALGLAAVRAGDGEPTRQGLSLAAALPALEGAEMVASAGWRWGDQITVTSGRVLRGPKIAEVASRSKVETPAGIDDFLRVDGGRIDAASGGPVLDAEGNVLAVRLDVAAKNMTLALAMPATTLRKSLLSTQPELKSLADLPEPLWPVHVLRLPGEPTDEKVLGRMSQAIQRAMVCNTCGGKGKVDPGRWMFGRDIGCPTCAGTGIRLTPEAYEMLTEWAIQGTRIVWAPGVSAQRRTLVRKMGVEMMGRMGKVGQAVRRILGFTGGVDLVQPPKAKMPYGILLYARIQEEVDGPDGKYLILEALNTRTRAAVRVEDLVGDGGLGPQPGHQVPKQDTWFALAGTVVSTFRTDGGRQDGTRMDDGSPGGGRQDGTRTDDGRPDGGRPAGGRPDESRLGAEQGIYVLPFEWTGYIPPADDGRGDRPDRPGPPDRPPAPRDRGNGWGGGPGRGW